MQALTRFVLRHRAAVALAWLLVAVAGLLTVSGTLHRMSSEFSAPGQAAQTDTRIVAGYGSGGSQAPYLPVLTVPAGQRVTQPAVAARAGRVFAAIAAAVPGARVAGYSSTGDTRFVTSAGRTTFALVFTPPAGSFSGPDAGPAITRAADAALPAGWRFGLTGQDLLSDGAPAARGTGILVETIIGSAGALLILALVFGSLLALLPLLVGGVSVLGTFLVVRGLTELTAVSQIVGYLIALVGLGVAIDYSLLVVTRWREERAAGRPDADAVTAAMRHAGRAVVFSGLTVAIALLAMVVLPVPALRSVGYGGVLVPLVSVAAAVTLLPVILAAAGPRLDWPRLRTERRPSPVFARWAAFVYRRRWVSAAAGLTIMALLAAPALSLHLGLPGASAEATAGPAHDALVTLTAGGVPAGVLTPDEVLTSGGSAAAVAARAAALPGVYAAVAPGPAAGFARGGTAVVDVLPVTESTLPAGQGDVASVEHALLGSPGVAGVGGAGAELIGFDHAVYGDFPLMLALIAAATFVLLARALRSAVLAVKAVACNLLSLAAAYGVMTWVFQDGHGSAALFGVPATGAITMWVPLMVFAFLFGLSTDYEVFILARIREAYDASGDARAAVVTGLGRTGRLVTGAAAILTFGFVSMSTAGQTDIKILATGLGAGIVVDALVVRCLLVPALVALFGRANWWLPAWAGRALRAGPPAEPSRPPPGEPAR